MTPPPRSRRRRLGLSCLGLLSAAGLALWLARDLPRRAVAAILSERLAAHVTVERLTFRGADRFELAGLEIERVRGYPFIESLRIAELQVEGSLAGILDSRFDRLLMRGVEARLAPAPPVEAPDRPLPMIGELVIEPAVVKVAAADGGEDATLEAGAELRDLGTRAGGRVHLRSPRIAVESLFALFEPRAPPPLTGPVRDLTGVLELGPGGTAVTATAAAAELSKSGHRLELDRPRWSYRKAGRSSTAALDAAGARLTLAGGTASIAAPRLAATLTEAGDGTLSVALRPELDGLESGVVEADWDPGSRRLRRLDARFAGLDLQRLFPGLGVEAEAGLELHGAGERLDYAVRMAPRRLDLEDGILEIGGGATLEAGGSLPFEPLARLEAPIWAGPIEASLDLPSGRGRWGSIAVPASLFPAALRFEGRWLGALPLRLEGEAHLATAAVGDLFARGEIVGGAAGAEGIAWRWTGTRLEDLREVLRQAGLPTPSPSLGGVASAAGRLSGPLTRAAARGGIHLREARAAGAGEAPAWKLDGGSLSADWSWEGPDAPFRLHAVHATADLTTSSFRDLPLELSAAGRIDPSGSRGGIDEARLTSPGLGTARWSGDWQRPPGGRLATTGGLVLEALDLAAWQRVAGPLAENAALAEFDLRGEARAELEVAADSAGSWRLEGQAELAAAGFASGDGSRVMEGLAGRWQVTAGGAPSAPVEAGLTGTAGGFLLLWNTFFGDFSAAETALDLSGRRQPATGGGTPAWSLRVRAEVPEGPAAEATLERPASGEGEGLRYTVGLEDPDLTATHRRYLAPLLEDLLGRFEVGGRLTARARGSYLRVGGDPATWSLLGALTLEDFRLASGGGQAAVAGLDLELPLELRRRPGPTIDFTGPRLSGRLAFERLALRGLELPATDTDLLVEADSVALEKPLTLAILGGRLTLEQLTLARLLRPGRHLETGIRLEDVRLDRVARELRLFPLEGALNGDLPLVRLSPDRLWVEGGGRAEVFGGVVEVRDISGEDVLSRFPKLRLSADFRDIDLGALTRRLDFGEMTGTLDGTLEDCELFRGVPVRFSARLATVEKKGVPRTVDVKAINNITILGTGQGTNVFDQGLRKFFQKYTYSALGVTLRLDDDRLLMRGLERRRGKELFLRGRLPFRIDVVNAQPGMTVSFQAMVRRLQSLDFARAKTER